MCDAPSDAFSAGAWCESANVLVAALAETERERDELAAWKRDWEDMAIWKRATAAEARVAELAEAAHMVDLLAGPAPHEQRDAGEMEWWQKLRAAVEPKEPPR